MFPEYTLLSLTADIISAFEQLPIFCNVNTGFGTLSVRLYVPSPLSVSFALLLTGVVGATELTESYPSGTIPRGLSGLVIYAVTPGSCLLSSPGTIRLAVTVLAFSSGFSSCFFNTVSVPGLYVML